MQLIHSTTIYREITLILDIFALKRYREQSGIEDI